MSWILKSAEILDEKCYLAVIVFVDFKQSGFEGIVAQGHTDIAEKYGEFVSVEPSFHSTIKTYSIMGKTPTIKDYKVQKYRLSAALKCLDRTG